MSEFDEVYRAHVQAVFRFALRCVSDRALAEDLTAEAFLELYLQRGRIDESRLPGWLLTVVRNRARDHWRRQQVERRYLEQTPAPAPDDTSELARWILEGADLKPVHRTCLMLRYVHGMTRAEIASALGLSEVQVKGYLQYALELLRKSIAEVKGGSA
ncbi:MAG: RNA polymerase sigma factor [Betaproteobacteria bacterium]